MEKRNVVTIFTPSYNRAYIIEKLYISLKNQKKKNFEWIIVDDGSKDNTEDLILTWIKIEKEFEIKYYKQNNGGKHRAINRGLDVAKGKMFFIVDSDDVLTIDATEKIEEWEKTLPENAKFAGIAGNKGYSETQIIGATFDDEYKDATSLERASNNILGDKAEIFYTDILKNYKFPEIENERFITEDVIWLKIANDGYKIRWFNEIIYIANYLEDGLSAKINSLLKNNPKGYALYVKQNIKYYNKRRVRTIYEYFCYYKNLKGTLSEEDIRKNLELKHIAFSIMRGLGLFFSIAIIIKKILRRK